MPSNKKSRTSKRKGSRRKVIPTQAIIPLYVEQHFIQFAQFSAVGQCLLAPHREESVSSDQRI